MSISPPDRKGRPTAAAKARLCILALAAIAAAALAGCGTSGSSSDDEIVASSNPISSKESASNIPKTYWPSPNASTVTGKSQGQGSEVRDPHAPEQPCRLVSRDEAASILGGSVKTEVGLQGPTCIYSAGSSQEQVALVVEQVAVGELKSEAQEASQVTVAGRAGWCLRYGSTSVVVPLTDGRVLAVTGPCAKARAFATLAVPRISS